MTIRETDRFRIRGCYPLGPRFPTRSANDRFCNSPRPAFSVRINSNRKCWATPSSYNPEGGLLLLRFGLFPFRSPLLRKSRVVFSPSAIARVRKENNCLLFSVPPDTKMFQFSGCALRNKSESTGFTRRGFPIRTFPDRRLLSTSPKLIAARPRPSSLLWSQGILRVLF